MSGLIVAGSGLLVPEGAQEAAIQRALQQHDPDLRLVPQDSDVYGRRIYHVWRYNGPDRDAHRVCVWADEQLNPLPLSSALVDYVQSLDRNGRGRQVDVDELERKFREEQRKDYRRDAEAILADHDPRIEGKRHQPLPRSRSLYLARLRQRAKLPKEMWS